MRQISVQGKFISIDENDYISLTDMAKCISENYPPEEMISSWLGKTYALRFLNAWEKMHNEAFDIKEMENILSEATENKFKLSPEKYKNRTAAIGIISRLDCSGDIFAHKEIALEFCCLSLPEFRVYMIKEFQKLKDEESKRLESDRTWHLSKITDLTNNAQTLLDNLKNSEKDKH